MNRKQPKLKLATEKKKVIIVSDGDLHAFLDELHGDHSGSERVFSYVGNGDYRNDTYHRVYVNDDYKINRRTLLAEDMGAIKSALGLGDDPHEYFLLHCSW